MENCIFCKIGKGELTSEVIFEDADFAVVKDIHPKAPTHWLVIPKSVHVASIKDIDASYQLMVGKMILVAKEAAARQGLEGYKLVFNVGREGGQVIDHLHLHILGGWGRDTEKSINV